MASSLAVSGERTATDYGIECIREMGVDINSLPRFMSCTDSSASTQVPENDSFSWLTGAVDYSRISRVTAGSVILMLNCRQKMTKLRLEEEGSDRIVGFDPFLLGRNQEEREAEHQKTHSTWTFDSVYGFHDVALIIHQPTTGKTCFFQDSNLGRETLKYGPLIPMPYARTASLDVKRVTTEIGKLRSGLDTGSGRTTRLKSMIASSLATNADAFWAPPRMMAEQIRCTSCHDSGPWIRSPRWAEAKNTEGERIVPSRPSRNGLPTEPYHVLGAELRDAWFPMDRPRVVSTDPIPTVDRKSTEPQRCVSCHAVGGLKSTRRDPYPNDRGLLQYYSSWVDLETLYPVSHFIDDRSTSTSENPRMPPLGKGERHDMRDWNANYLRPYLALQCCGDFPDALGCRRADLGDAVAPADWILGSDGAVSCLPPVVTVRIESSRYEQTFYWDSKYSKTCELNVLDETGKTIRSQAIPLHGSMPGRELKTALPGIATHAEWKCKAGWTPAFPGEIEHVVKIDL